MKEKLFKKLFQDLFVGPTIEGKGGSVTLFRAKEMYYQKLVDEIQKEAEKYGEFKEEVYGLLNEFLSLFDNKFGTIYLKNSDDKNSLWDMQKRLYYVKTDVVFQSMVIESNGIRFLFDAGSVEYKKNNERRSIVYELKEVKDNMVVFLVYYKEGEVKTDIKGILETIGDRITEVELKKVFKKYEKKNKTNRNGLLYS